jgi:nucleoside-diphosphate kinase
MAQERTIILLKPDTVKRQLIGEVISRFEKRNLKILGIKLLNVTKDMAKLHYKVHEGKPFYDELVDYITSGPIVAMVLEGENVITVTRNMIGALKPVDAQPGTIRGDFASDIQNNLVHGSDSPASADHEIPIFFSAEELI